MIGFLAFGLFLMGVVWLLWWVLIVAAVVAVAGIVWRAVTQC